MWTTRCLRPQKGPGEWGSGRGKWLAPSHWPRARAGLKGMGIETRVGPGMSGQSGVLTGHCSTWDSGQRPEAWQGAGGVGTISKSPGG